MASCGHMKIISTVIIYFTILQFCHGQKVWTYQECAAFALANNIELSNSQLLVDEQRVYFKDAKNAFLPTLGASVGYDLNKGRSIDPNSNTYVENAFFSNVYRIFGSVNLFKGFEKQNRISFEKYNLMSEEEAFGTRQNELIYSVLVAYINLLVDQGLIGIIEEQFQLSKYELNRITRMIEVGRSAVSEKYEVEARYANDEFLLLKQKNSANLSSLELKRLMNLPIDSILYVADIQLFEGLDLTIHSDSLLAQAKQNLPRIKAVTNRLEAAEKQVKMVRSSIFPTLDLYGNYNTRYSDTFTDQSGETIPFNDQFNNNQSLNYGIALRIPIFSAFSNRNKIQVSKIARIRAVNNYKIEIQNLEYEINQVQLEWNAAISEYLSALKKEQSEQKALEAAVKKREKGRISVMEFYDARNNLAVAQAEILRTRLQEFLKERTIMFYLTGNLL